MHDDDDGGDDDDDDDDGGGDDDDDDDDDYDGDDDDDGGGGGGGGGDSSQPNRVGGTEREAVRGALRGSGDGWPSSAGLAGPCDRKRGDNWNDTGVQRMEGVGVK
ncbi:hypothetical protein ACOMHN_009591 [Nucella lapillus]